MRVVLDTNVLIRANPKARGPARELLQRIISGENVLVTSPFLLQELARVLAYPRVAERWKLRPPEIDEYVQILASVSEVVAPVAGVPIVLKDADDDPVLYTAVAGEVDILCTLDGHFYEGSVQAFAARVGFEIMDDTALLRLIRGS
jgi:putative PIN family toxin of toxin-antitoxin system